ncbi:CRISPR-associated protein Csx15 [Achromobacter xylosoxidans]|uniref:CRISPR-associated protein Csx15 n=1 Tax=Alcaligenes xylosoxydans xylosoxydans TaxID=85698 RepID=UPI00128E51A6|nr:CRISPR-associated protein Csx15 [Achromobacter xylosoxidans]
MTGYLINFSGHPLSARAEELLKESFEKIVEAHWPEFDFDEPLDQQMQAVFKKLDVTLDGRTPITIIPPGQSTLAILLVSFVHGMIGHFPRLCYLGLSDNGVYLPKFQSGINIQNMRTAGRRLRTKLVSGA